jgi:hypothetical protein
VRMDDADDKGGIQVEVQNRTPRATPLSVLSVKLLVYLVIYKCNGRPLSVLIRLWVR